MGAELLFPPGFLAYFGFSIKSFSFALMPRLGSSSFPTSTLQVLDLQMVHYILILK